MAYKRISPTPVNEGGTGAITLTDHGVLLGSGTGAITATAVGSTGQVLQGVTGADAAYSTATYPSTAGTSGKVLLSNGTNYVDSTPTFPNASASSGKFIRSDGTNWIASTPTLPTSAGTAGKILVSDATNYIESTPTFPNASATTRKIIVSDGTNWTASTETYAVPGTSGNVLTSDGTNWTSAAPSGGGNWVLLQTQDPSAASSVAFSSTYITSTYRTYVLVIDNLITSTTGNLLLTLSDDNGSTYKNTNYISDLVYMAHTGATFTNINNTTYFLLVTGYGTTLTFSGTIWIYNLGFSAKPKILGETYGANTYWEKVWGTYSSAITVNNILLSPGSGTITGKVSLYGITP